MCSTETEYELCGEVQKKFFLHFIAKVCFGAENKKSKEFWEVTLELLFTMLILKISAPLFGHVGQNNYLCKRKRSRDSIKELTYPEFPAPLTTI